MLRANRQGALRPNLLKLTTTNRFVEDDDHVNYLNTRGESATTPYTYAPDRLDLHQLQTLYKLPATTALFALSTSTSLPFSSPACQLYRDQPKHQSHQMLHRLPSAHQLWESCLHHRVRRPHVLHMQQLPHLRVLCVSKLEKA